MDELKQRIILDVALIILAFLIIEFYIIGIISPTAYFSDFLLATMIVIGTIMVLVILIRDYSITLIKRQEIRENLNKD